MKEKDFDTSHLDHKAQRVADLIYNHIKKVLDEEPTGGGCKAFYSPKEWIERGERYGHNATLILVHDGGDLAPFVNLDCMAYNLYEGLSQVLFKAGFYIESCTCWYAAVYEIRSTF